MRRRIHETYGKPLLNCSLSRQKIASRPQLGIGAQGRRFLSGSKKAIEAMSAPRKRRSNGRATQVTVKQVAEAARVSMMTVSNVIHDRPNVGDAVRAHVKRHIKELGYVPNRAAQELAGVAYARFGLLYPSVRNAFIASVLVGALTAASRLKADISIQRAELNDPATLRKTMHRMEDAGVEGFLLPSPIAEFAARAFRKRPLRVPAVAIAPGFPIPGMSSVRCDEHRASFELVSMLLDLGHTRIGHLSGPESQTGSVARYEGYRSALKARAIDVRPEAVIRTEFRYQDGLRAAEELLRREPRVTAIFAANDTLAASVVAAAHRLGIEVPQLLSVVGYDDSPIAEQIWPGLTTVRQDAAALTERAVELLNQNVQAWRTNRSIQAGEDVLLPYELVRRPSIAEQPTATAARRRSVASIRTPA